MRRYPVCGKAELNEFGKEALRLVKELADDEVSLRSARDSARRMEHEANIAKAEDEADCIERGIERKLRLLETIIHH